MSDKKEHSPIVKGLIHGLKSRLKTAFDNNPDITAEEFAADAVPHIADLFGYKPREEAEKMARALIALAVKELQDEIKSARSPA